MIYTLRHLSHTRSITDDLDRCDRSLVGESVDRLVRVLTDLLVGTHEPDAHNPGAERAADRERSAGGEGNGVAGCVFVHPEVL